jgi:Zn-dependent M28 family amino/carboxypeptidase
MRIFLAAALLALAAGPTAFAEDLTASAAAMRDRALADRTAWDLTESLTTEIGARPTGSPAMARARDWGVARLKALGFANVHVEEFQAEAWIRGAESAEILAPYPQKLAILGLGRSAPTPKGGLTGEVALFTTFEALIAQPPGSLKGKIVVLNQPMPRTQDASGYAALSRNRMRGTAEASQRGAAAFLVRSVSTDDTRLPHTGSTSQAQRMTPIPAAALSPPDADLLARMIARGAPVQIRLDMSSRTLVLTPAWNVVGEIVGTERPDEVIVIGGHLDSWDPGTGAVDDAAGVAVTTAAARLAGQGGSRRTLRVVMWGAEELGDSGEAYAAAHKDEVGNMVMVSESDAGAGRIWSVRLPVGSAAHPAMQAFAQAVAPLKVIVSREPAKGAGSDVADLVAAGAPSVAFGQDMSRYFDLHHSADDTLDKIDPADLAQMTAVWATFLHVTANSDVDFRALGAGGQ